MITIKRLLLLPLFALSLTGLGHAQEKKKTNYKPGASSEQEAFRDLKYGCFIHWNHSSIMGEQISWIRNAQNAAEYDALRQQFTAKDFDPAKWAKILKDAGFTYVVLVPKHHDGFCLFDTKSTDNNIIKQSPFGKDFIKLLAPALRKEGIQVCLYYSILDWTEPTYKAGAGADLSAYEKVMYTQLDELFSNYGEISAIWFDGHWDPSWTQEKGRKLYNFIKSKQPKCLISNRVGPMPKTAGPIGCRPGSFSDENDIIGDYLTPERTLGAFYTDYPWESCLPLDKGNKWSWMPGGGFDNRPKSEIVRWIIESASGGGNLLLGVGPNEHGEIDAYHANRLMEVGVFLKLHGESIYGTRPGPYKPGNWPGASLSKGNKVYLHIFDMANGKRKLTLPPIGAKVLSYRLLTGTVDRHNKNYSLQVEQTDKALNVTLHPVLPNRPDTIVELTLDKPVKDLPLIETGERTLLKDHTAPPGEDNH